MREQIVSGRFSSPRNGLGPRLVSLLLRVSCRLQTISQNSVNKPKQWFLRNKRVVAVFPHRTVRGASPFLQVFSPPFYRPVTFLAISDVAITRIHMHCMSAKWTGGVRAHEVVTVMMPALCHWITSLRNPMYCKITSDIRRPPILGELAHFSSALYGEGIVRLLWLIVCKLHWSCGIFSSSKYRPGSCISSLGSCLQA